MPACSCPHCKTPHWVKDAQLNVAQGFRGLHALFGDV